VGVAWLREQGWSEEVSTRFFACRLLGQWRARRHSSGTLYAVDELSGFVMAVARVRPSKSIPRGGCGGVKKEDEGQASRGR